MNVCRQSWTAFHEGTITKGGSGFQKKVRERTILRIKLTLWWFRGLPRFSMPAVLGVCLYTKSTLAHPLFFMKPVDHQRAEFPRQYRIAAVEAGGTKVLCAYGSGPDDVLTRRRIATTTPGETLAEMVAFFADAIAVHGRPDAFGVVTFGPVDLRDENSTTYGSIMRTPKPGWQGVNWLAPLREAFPGVPLAIDTDVNGAALGELTWGAGRGLDSLAYITVGTGIGGGIIVGGRPVHGLLHPEVGHMRIPRTDQDRRAFAGNCPFHGDCLEGLASGPAILSRWGAPAESLPDDHEAWPTVASDLAWACANLACVVSPQRIIVGGGVFQKLELFPMVRSLVIERLAGYIDVPEIVERIDSYIVPPGLGQDAGISGAISLGQRSLEKARS
jgi:fructokinase